MPHERLVNYLKKIKKGNYSYDRAKLALLKKGWLARDIDDAWEIIKKEENFFGRQFFSLAVIGLVLANLSIVVLYLLLAAYLIHNLYFSYVVLSILAIISGWITQPSLQKMIEDIDMRTMIEVSISFISMTLLSVILMIMMKTNAGELAASALSSSFSVSIATIFFSVMLYFGFFHALLIKEFIEKEYEWNFFIVFSFFIIALVFLISYLANKILF